MNIETNKCCPHCGKPIRFLIARHECDQRVLDENEALKEAAGILAEMTPRYRKALETLKECRAAIHEMRCYDIDFYDRLCPALLPTIDALLEGEL